jgi:VirE N-terminal domain/Primase C terminal 2 (PriCT-2)
MELTTEIKDFILAPCQSYMRVKVMENKFKHEFDQIPNIALVLDKEIEDATAYMQDTLRDIRNKHGVEIMKLAVEYAKRLTGSSISKKTMISFFQNAMSTTPVNVPIGSFLKSEKFKERIEAVRQAQTKEQKDELKKLLPCATISGMFSKRSIEGCVNYNGLVCLDFDGSDNEKSVDEIKATLKEFDEVLYCGLSVGGKGVFAVVLTDNTDIKKHSIVVDAISDIFKEFGIIHDKGCKDVSRLRFISFDTEGYLNENAIPFQTNQYLVEKLVEKTRTVFTPTSDDSERTKILVEKYVSEIQRTSLDITNNYEDWVKIGFSLASYFGYDGEDYFICVSEVSSKFNLALCVKKYRHFVKAGRRSGIGAFINICKSHGLKVN